MKYSPAFLLFGLSLVAAPVGVICDSNPPVFADNSVSCTGSVTLGATFSSASVNLNAASATLDFQAFAANNRNFNDPSVPAISTSALAFSSGSVFLTVNRTVPPNPANPGDTGTILLCYSAGHGGAPGSSSASSLTFEGNAMNTPASNSCTGGSLPFTYGVRRSFAFSGSAQAANSASAFISLSFLVLNSLGNVDQSSTLTMANVDPVPEPATAVLTLSALVLALSVRGRTTRNRKP